MKSKMSFNIQKLLKKGRESDILIFFLVLTSMTIILIMQINNQTINYTSQDEIKKSELKYLTGLSDQFADIINNYIHEQTKLVNTFAKDHLFRDSITKLTNKSSAKIGINEINNFFISLLNSTDQVSEILLLNYSTGEVLISISSNGNTNSSGNKINDRVYTGAISYQGNSLNEDNVYFKEIYLDKDTISMAFSSIIRLNPNEIPGAILVVKIYPTILWELIAPQNLQKNYEDIYYENIGLGKTGEIILINSSGVAISPSRFYQDNSQFILKQNFSYIPGFKEALINGYSIGEATNYLQKHVFFNYIYLGFNPVSIDIRDPYIVHRLDYDLHWVLGIDIQVNEVFIPIYQIKNHQNSSLIIISSILCLLIIGIVFRKILTNNDIKNKRLIQELLYFLAQKGWSYLNTNFFVSVASYLGKVLDIDYVFIDTVDNKTKLASTLAFYSKGEIFENFDYDLENTPCANIYGKNLCTYPNRIQNLFPKDDVLKSINAVSYSGIPLWSSQGEPIGLIALIGTKPFENTSIIESMLQIVSTRVGAEVELKKESEILKDSELKYKHLSEDLEETVKERTKLLNDSIKDLEFFSYSITHDLQTPLSVVEGLGNLLLLEDENSINRDNFYLINQIILEIKKMRLLINDLLNFFRLGQKSLNITNIKMGEIVNDVLIDIKSLIKNTCKSVDFKVMDLIDCKGDSHLIKQVWLNLISNAVKYSSSNSHTKIEIGYKINDENKTIYYVKDNGIGFDMKDSDKLFRIFQRLHNNEYEGTGIGLALVKKIITNHRGLIWAESEINKGSAFYFILNLN
jgi:signal transduction histidine kinase